MMLKLRLKVNLNSDGRNGVGFFGLRSGEGGPEVVKITQTPEPVRVKKGPEA